MTASTGDDWANSIDPATYISGARSDQIVPANSMGGLGDGSIYPDTMAARASELGYDWENPPGIMTILRGTTGDQTLTGDNLGDLIIAGTGNDTMIGGTGDDLFRIGPGVDTIVGGGGFDRISFYQFAAEATQPVIADLATGTIYNNGFGQTDHFTGIEALGDGSLQPEILIGDDNPNELWAGRGSVVLAGGGDDVILVNDAPALVDGGTGVNSIAFTGMRDVAPATVGQTFPDSENATQGVVIDLAKHMILNDGWDGSGVVTNIQDVYGSPNNDVIIGDAQNNVLDGGGGNDVLTGGGGHDIFLFDSNNVQAGPMPAGHDVITDFESGLDKIAIDMPGVSSMADLQLSQDAQGDLVITYDSNQDTITLLHVQHVTAQDFIFGPI